MTRKDILDDIKTEQTVNRVDDIQTMVLMGGQWGLFFGAGYMNNINTQMFGITLFISSLFVMMFVWMYPGYKAAIIAAARIYLKATVFHGFFFTDKQFEVIDAPKVVAKLEDGKLEVYEDDLNYSELFKMIGITNLTDIDINKRIKTAFEERYKKAALEQGIKKKRTLMDRIRRKGSKSENKEEINNV